MKLIITIKPTATLDRIEQLSEFLHDLQIHYVFHSLEGFPDVIESVTGEK